MTTIVSLCLLPFNEIQIVLYCVRDMALFVFFYFLLCLFSLFLTLSFGKLNSLCAVLFCLIR